MTRRPSPTVADPAQTSFFDVRTSPAHLADLDARVREALGETLGAVKLRTGMDRHDVTAEVNRLQPHERELTKNMLDRCAAPSAADWQLPAWRLPALCRVTEDYRLLSVLVEACDHKAVPSEAAALGELMVLELEERRLRGRMEALRKSLPQEAMEWAAREAARRAG